MNVKALLFAIVGFIVAAFYALESFLFFKANGVAAPLLFKLLICGVGIYFFWRNITRIKKSNANPAPGDAV